MKIERAIKYCLLGFLLVGCGLLPDPTMAAKHTQLSDAEAHLAKIKEEVKALPELTRQLEELQAKKKRLLLRKKQLDRKSVV